MVKRKQNTDYQWSKGNRTKRLSMIKRKQNEKTINDQKETEQKDYRFILTIDNLCVLFHFDHW
jgi:hypothetical protein